MPPKKKTKKARKTLRRYLGISGRPKQPKDGWSIDSKGLRYTKRF